MNNIDSKIQEKDIFKLFNEVKIDEKEFEDFETDVQILQKERIKKSLKKKIKENKFHNPLKYVSAAAAIAIISLIGIETATPAFAEKIPAINYIVQSINDRFDNHGEYIKYTQMINKTVSNNGIDFTINEVLADNSKFAITYTIKSDKKIKDLETFGLSKFLKVNGSQNGSTGSIMGYYVDDYTYVANEDIHTALPQDSKMFDVDLNIDDIMGNKGSWNFAFGVSKDEITKNSQIFNPTNKISFPDGTNVNVDKVVFSPIDTSIFVNGTFKNYERRNTFSEWNYGSWIVYDDKGNELSWTGGGSQSNLNSKTFTGEFNFKSMKEIPKYLTVVPCNILSTGGGETHIDNGKEVTTPIDGYKTKEISKVIDGIFPIELVQGNVGKIVISEVKTENNITTIRFTATGKAPFTQANEVHVKDETGNIVSPKLPALHRDENNPNVFTIEYKAFDKNKNYTIYTSDLSNYEFRDDLKFNIELNK
ncbi:DUF4179 domain-containing protein [Clostridium sp. YIM B02551]|uniref:DUF4179 domain-containing protein n=1 Tax=Clostridium sp. YIM B02551 TaxID=2910679 RepID=UPI001EE9B847|nr:DUF4179 domain-containing protein [Clostridium sp. YIM B02551]